MAVLDDKGVINVCPSCGQKNRTPYQKLGQMGQCGKCSAEIGPPAVPLDIDSEARFDALVGGSVLPVVVDYWAPWCGPCRQVAPELVQVAAVNAGTWVVIKVNTEALPNLGARFGIRSIPTMVVFREGREVTRTSGARPARAIEDWVRQALGG